MRTATILLAALFLLSGARAGARDDRFAPELRGERWLNSAPLQVEKLRGRVLLVEFWTFACWNCKNVEPYVKAWHAKYAADGLTVIGVHTPELAHERSLANVRAYVKERGIAYPVLVDNGFATWRAYGNRYWPAMYLVDKRGRIRHVAIGEGRYDETEAKIRELLAEAA